MSRKSIQVASKRNTTSRLFGPGKGKSLGRGMTSETIADDIAAFKKRGGRIEVLGNTPSRTRAKASAFRSKDNPQTATAGKASARG
ncbi:hypothetical protein RHOFW104T7_06205 [Rhodanobacter thiooxydans]|uniref:Uncharacterized protein n=1 Tax=Rhodanobacter thiooxydans TaxID=416169 RepID=A0A154QMC5_9GAMM|nr:hypothetical protein [Rhodanobacter thiooxydans]EIL98174.1 hypothetical protein UUA_12535 [Rhodanobacter thiooxydans LCS2]KZC24926.1 hypothetical protein RHOFW104T7_06205 [Rhodanobacter thiooxydans]MCW0200467.1 hypothetical protein [Rhodanobacter thiooxydans]